MSYSELKDDIREILVDKSCSEIWTKRGKKGLEYLKNRGITEHTITSWKLGYCPEDVQDIIFHDRIIIPYYDQYGKLIAVSARKRIDEKPYWWNESFEKSSYLFGLNKAKWHILRNNLVVIVEGQFDVISLHQKGINCVVGLCGSFLNDKQLILLSRYTNRFLLAFDTDENQAGQESTKKTFDFLTNKNFYIYKWYFPTGEDPDSYIRKYGKRQCIEDIKNILSKYTFKSRHGLVKDYYFGENNDSKNK